MNQIEGLPPQNLEAERAILGSMLLDKDVVSKVVERIISPDEFYSETHRIIYRTMVEVWNKEEKVDIVTVKNVLREKNLLREIGGNVYLADLVSSVPTTRNVDQYVTIVREKSWRRKLMRFLSIERFEKEDPVTLELEMKHWFQTHRLVDLAKWNLRDTVRKTMERIEHRRDHGIDLSSGFGDLDRRFGGFEGGKLYVLGGRPSMGKTAFEINMSLNIGKIGKKPLIIQAEGSDLDSVMRMLGDLGSVNSQKFRTGAMTDQDWERLGVACQKLVDLPIVIRDFSSPTLPQIAESVWQYKPDILFIDYLQLMSLEGVPGEGPNYQYGWIVKRLKALAKDEDIPIVVLSQLSRRVEYRKSHVPTLADLRDSGEIEQDADVAMLLYWPWRYDPTEPKNVNIMLVEKARDGECGMVKFWWEPEFYAFHQFIEGMGEGNDESV